MGTQKVTSDTIIGKGRSGQVIRVADDSGRDLAIKVFSGVDGLTNFVNYILTGAPNPYAWNEAAVESAHYRREILSLLIRFWFDSGVRIATSYGTDWHEDEKAYQLTTEFINGRPVALKQPFSKATDPELKQLSKGIMKPLRKHLIDSGMYGLVWQAGKGNPVALNNFLLDKSGDWVWIDAESGVPALFPLNPLSLFGFYLPKSIRFGRPLFDDVDIWKLKKYIEKNQDELCIKLGDDKVTWLNEYVRRLQTYQGKWKAVKRVQKSIQFQLKKGTITPVEADWYSRHQFVWIWKEFGKLFKKAFKKVFYLVPASFIAVIISFKYWASLKKSFRFIFIGKYRKDSIEEVIQTRISDWEDRKQMSPADAAFLREQANKESTSPYLADFIILIVLKPFIKVIEVVLLPALYAADVIDEATLAIGITMGGVIYRTIYTLGKMIHEKVFQLEEHPRWIALIIGLIPSAGNLAYPMQMVYSAGSKSMELAEFLMYDVLARVGAKIPIWGGKDTRTEHFFNRLPGYILPKLKNYKNKQASESTRS